MQGNGLNKFHKIISEVSSFLGNPEVYSLNQNLRIMHQQQVSVN